MIRLQWNALRVGSHVLVHDEELEGMPLATGRVTAVEQAVGSNDLTIRISPTGGKSRTVRPRRLLVHQDRLDLDEHCWRCVLGPTTS